MSSLPNPTRWYDTDDGLHMPVWQIDGIGEVAPWADGFAVGNDQYYSVTPDAVEKLGAALMAAAAQMRKWADASH